MITNDEAAAAELEHESEKPKSGDVEKIAGRITVYVAGKNQPQTPTAN